MLTTERKIAHEICMHLIVDFCVDFIAYFKFIRITRLKKNKTDKKKNSLSQSDNEFSIGEIRKEFYPSLLSQREIYV